MGNLISLRCLVEVVKATKRAMARPLDNADLSTVVNRIRHNTKGLFLQESLEESKSIAREARVNVLRDNENLLRREIIVIAEKRLKNRITQDKKSIEGIESEFEGMHND